VFCWYFSIITLSTCISSISIMPSISSSYVCAKIIRFVIASNHSEKLLSHQTASSLSPNVGCSSPTLHCAAVITYEHFAHIMNLTSPFTSCFGETFSCSPCLTHCGSGKHALSWRPWNTKTMLILSSLSSHRRKLLTFCFLLPHPQWPQTTRRRSAPPATTTRVLPQARSSDARK
jgi:hypothetical protein